MNEQGPAAGANLGISLADASAAIQTLRFGGSDQSTLAIEISPAARATVAPVITALRWGAVMFGMVFAAPKAFEGDLAVVTSLALCLWATSYRAFRPLVLASLRRTVIVAAIVDGAIFGIGAGFSGGPVSPFALCALAAVVVATLGWGPIVGLATALAAGVAMAISATVTGADPELLSQQALTVGAATIVAILVIAALRRWLTDAEQRRQTLAGRVETLSETNDLLALLNRAAITIPGALDRNDVVIAIGDQLRDAFGPQMTALLEPTADGNWTTVLSDNTRLAAEIDATRLPTAFVRAIGSEQATLTARCEQLHPDAESVLVASLTSKGRVVGLVALGHGSSGAWTARDARVLDGLRDVLALSLDNVRRFGQLGSLAANKERERIARDLHDRLGQMLTFISLEVERVMDASPSAELERLHGDVQSALDELRATLRQLRTTVTPDHPFTELAAEQLSLVERRQGIATSLNVEGPEHRLPPAVEQEFLRMLQEALNNIVKHADASRVEVRWAATPHQASLTIIDDGRGFDPQAALRPDAFGMRGMRERATSIDAQVRIDSAPGRGTRITVTREVDHELV